MKSLCVAVIILLLSVPIITRAAISVIGAQSYDSPLGCAPDSVFNLVAGTEIETLLSTGGGSPTTHGFVVSGDTVYQFPRASINSNLWVATSSTAPSFINSNQFSTASSPDEGGTYNPFPLTGSKALITTVATAATCGGSRCPHFYIWNSGPAIDTSFVASAVSIGQGETFTISDGLNYYVIANSSSGSNRRLLKFDTGFSLVNSINPGNIFSQLADSGTDIWVVNGTLPGLSRISKDTLTQTNFPVSGLSSALLANIAFNVGSQEKYVVSTGGTSAVHRISNTNTLTGTISLSTELVNNGGVLYDEKAQKLYVVTDAIGFKRVRRINPASFTVEQTLSIPSGNSTFSAAEDFVHKFIWISDVDTPSHIQRVQLCT